MQVGDMMAFIQYTMQIIAAFLMISLISVMLPDVYKRQPSRRGLPENFFSTSSRG